MSELRAQVVNLLQDAWELGYECGAKGISSARTVTLDAMTDTELAEHGWVKLPVDADGDVLHIGDKVDSDHYEDGTVTGIQFYEMANGGIRTLIAVRPDGWDVATWHTPDGYRHYHATTVEDVLRELVREVSPDAEWEDELFAEYADRIKDELRDE